MDSVNGWDAPEPPLGTARQSAARCIARALVCGFDACDEAEIPLTQLQRVAVLEAVLCEFDGFGEHLSSLGRVSRILHNLGPSGSEPLYLA
jgi:hypothetical protein